MKVLQRKINHNEFIKILTNKKDANNEAEYEEPSVTYDPVVKEPSYSNIF